MKTKRPAEKNLGKVFSLRLSAKTEKAVLSRAERTGQNPSVIIRQLCEQQVSSTGEELAEVKSELAAVKNSLAETQKTLSILADVLAKTATKKEAVPVENDGQILEKLEAILKDMSGMKFNVQVSAFASNTLRIMFKEFAEQDIYDRAKAKAFIDMFAKKQDEEAARFGINLKKPTGG